MSLSPEMLSALPIVVRVAETRSFSEAARQLGLSPSGVSRYWSKSAVHPANWATWLFCPGAGLPRRKSARARATTSAGSKGLMM